MKKSRIKEMSIEITVGAFMFMVLLALGVFTIILSRESLFQPNYTYEILFKNVMGLREGDNVLVRGVDVGKIKKIHMKPDFVQLYVSLDMPLSLHEDYKIEILPMSILGGRFLLIYEGSTNRPMKDMNDPGMVIIGKDPVDMVTEATMVVEKIKNALDDGDILENIRLIMQNLQEVTTNLKEGKGSIGKLFSQDELYDEIKGVLGDVRQVIGNLKEVSEGLANGEGTLGRLLAKDATLHNEMKAITANLKTFSTKLAQGQGLLGRILDDDDPMQATLAAAIKEVNEAFKEVREAFGSIKEIAGSIKEGKGTIGKLVYDDALYEEIRDLIAEVRASVDDFRETTPITTFSSLFFGVF